MIYLVCGSTQEFLLNNEVKKIIKQTIGEVDEFNLSTYTYPDCNIDNIVDECLTIPLMSNKKAIVVKNCTFLQNKTDKFGSLLKYILNPLDSTELILVCGGEINEQNEIVKSLHGYSKITKIAETKDSDWPQVISQLISNMNIEIDDDAKEEFVRRTKGNLAYVLGELSKLKTIGTHITLDIVESLIPRPLEDNVFDMLVALLKNANDKALLIYKDLSIQGHEPISLISVFASQLRFMYQVRYLKEQGYSNDQVANELKTKSGRVYFTLKDMGAIEKETILLMLNELADLDEKIKYSDIDKNIAFELFLAKQRG